MEGEDTNMLDVFFCDGDSALQELIRTHLILSNILGDFLAEHLDDDDCFYYFQK